MISFRDFLKEQFKDKEFEAEFYKGLEKLRIATEIAYHREKKGLTQAQLAKLINTSQSTIARLENPDYKNYSMRTLRKIAETLDLELVVSLREKYQEEEKIAEGNKDKTPINYYIVGIYHMVGDKINYTSQVKQLANKEISSKSGKIKEENAA